MVMSERRLASTIDSVPLSVVILTKNEAGRIRDCIESVRWAEDVLVVDDESTDDTVAIAESLGARVLRRKMEIEGRHRNWANAQAKHEWVLSLDADERVTPELAQEITRLLQNGSPYETYAIPRRNYIGDRWIRYGGWYPSAQLKLFKKSVFQWEETTVHPRAIANTACGTLEHDLLHFSYRDLSDFVNKMNRQTTLETQKWITDKRRMPLQKALWRSIDRFFRSYVSKHGSRDGWVGFFAAVCGGMYQWLAFAKFWEHTLPASSLSSDGLQRDTTPTRVLDGPRQRLTVLLITKNEEARINRCFASIAWADQIVVVDGQSTDQTVELCRAAGATVISRSFSGSFAEERNAGLDVATGDWVLQMDADEVVTPQLREAIERILSSWDGRTQAYQVRRRNIFLGRFMRYGGWYHHHLCLFRRAGHRYEGLVHERLNIHGPIGRLDVDLQHEPFTSIEQFITRQNRYTTLQAREMHETTTPLPFRAARRILWQRPLKRFWKFYVKKQGFREGMHGLVFSSLFAWVDFLQWAKYCELAYGVHAMPQDTSATR